MYDYHISLLVNTREYIILSFKLYFTFILVSFHFNFHPANVSLVNEFFFSCYNKGSLFCVCCIGMYFTSQWCPHSIRMCIRSVLKRAKILVNLERGLIYFPLKLPASAGVYFGNDLDLAIYFTCLLSCSVFIASSVCGINIC